MDPRITPELLEKARAAGSPEEILAIAKEHAVTLTAEEAQDYFLRHHKTGELSDDELDAVSGGGCSRTVGEQQYTVVTSCTPCFTGQYWHLSNPNSFWYIFGCDGGCGRCGNLKLDKGVGYCRVSGQ